MEIEQRTRKPKPTNYETRVQIRLSQQMLTDLKAYAGEKQMSKVIRKILENYLYGNKKIIEKEELKRKKFMHQDDDENKELEATLEMENINIKGERVVETIQQNQDREQRIANDNFDLFID